MERDELGMSEVIERLRKGEEINAESDGSAEVLAILQSCPVSEQAFELVFLAIQRFGCAVFYGLKNILQQVEERKQEKVFEKFYGKIAYTLSYFDLKNNQFYERRTYYVNKSWGCHFDWSSLEKQSSTFTQYLERIFLINERILNIFIFTKHLSRQNLDKIQKRVEQIVKNKPFKLNQFFKIGFSQFISTRIIGFYDVIWKRIKGGYTKMALSRMVNMMLTDEDFNEKVLNEQLLTRKKFYYDFIEKKLFLEQKFQEEDPQTFQWDDYALKTYNQLFQDIEGKIFVEGYEMKKVKVENDDKSDSYQSEDESDDIQFEDASDSIEYASERSHREDESERNQMEDESERSSSLRSEIHRPENSSFQDDSQMVDQSQSESSMTIRNLSDQ